VAKRLVGFRLDPALDGTVGHRFSGAKENAGHPFRGATVSAAEREIGFVTSAAISPTLGPIALGYVHRDFTAPGTAVQVEGHPATVTGLPMA